MRYPLAIFDFDGTLADSARWMASVLNDVARRYRFRTVSETELQALRGQDTRAILAHLGVSTWKLPFIASHMRTLASRSIDQIHPFPGALELLDQLQRRGVVIAIVSSNAEANVRAVLGEAGSARVRYYACGAGLFGKRTKFRKVLGWAGVTAAQALAIGDEPRDIEAARGEGLASGAVSWGYATPELLRASAPTLMFESFEEIGRALLG